MSCWRRRRKEPMLWVVRGLRFPKGKTVRFSDNCTIIFGYGVKPRYNKVQEASKLYLVSHSSLQRSTNAFSQVQNLTTSMQTVWSGELTLKQTQTITETVTSVHSISLGDILGSEKWCRGASAKTIVWRRNALFPYRLARLIHHKLNVWDASGAVKWNQA